jgi:hypothetical protein
VIIHYSTEVEKFDVYGIVSAFHVLDIFKLRSVSLNAIRRKLNLIFKLNIYIKLNIYLKTNGATLNKLTDSSKGNKNNKA